VFFCIWSNSVHSIDTNSIEKSKQLYQYHRKNACVIGGRYAQNLTKEEMLLMRRANGHQVGLEEIPQKFLLQSSKSTSIADISFKIEDIGAVNNPRLENLKIHYNPVNVIYIDSLPNTVLIQNLFDFWELGNEVKLQWELLENETVIQHQDLGGINIQPHQYQQIALNFKPFVKKTNVQYALRILANYANKPFWATDSSIYEKRFMLKGDF
jgi:hypothetical protein